MTRAEMGRYPYLVPTTAKSEAPRSVPLADFDAAILGPAPPSPEKPAAALDAATVERNLDAIRAEARAVRARLYPSED